MDSAGQPAVMYDTTACSSTAHWRVKPISSGGGRSSPEWAAFVNGLLIRYLDFNDTYLSKEPAHPSDNLAAVFAAGEAAGAGGKSNKRKKGKAEIDEEAEEQNYGEEVVDED